jgi:hypothetical protein
MNMRKLQLAILAAALAGASSASASLTVTIDSPSPEQIVDIAVSGTFTVPTTEVYAGINNETVNGVGTPSLCIDVYRDVTIGEQFSDYSYSTLASAPLTPTGPMGATAATDIEELWAAYYSSASADTSGLTAAALQVAVWEILGDGTHGYTVTASGNTAVTSEAADMLAQLASGDLTAKADLQALVSLDGQNYVVPNNEGGNVVPNAVPEPTTIIAGALLLLPFGASALRILRKTRTA